MKTNRNLPILVTFLAGACLCRLQATAGTLIGTEARAPAAVNLTAEGTLDWVHWGLTGAGDVDRKSGGANQISGVQTTPQNPDWFNDAVVGYSWTNGTPTANEPFTTTGIYITGLNKSPGKTNGFAFTVVADTNVKILKVYAGAWMAKVHFEARLSDGSAAAYVDESVNDFGASEAIVYTVRFAANSPGQTLAVRFYSVLLNDPAGNSTLMSASLGTPFTGTGTLLGTGTFLACGEAADLTTEGTLDWGHWGLTSATDFNHKTGVPQKISNVTLIGASAVDYVANSPSFYSWTDGTPTLTSSNNAGIAVAELGNGFQFTVPADTTTRVLRVYVNAYSARILLQAFLSDGSALPLYDGSFDATLGRQGPVRVYTVTYAAASAGQTLTVKSTIMADEGSGWISLQAATLQLPPAQTGILGGGYTVLATASTVNLTDEGRIDWAHWGRAEATDVDRKMGGTNVISDFAVIGLDQSAGPLEVEWFGDNFTLYSWTDGTPTANEPGSGTGIYLAQPGLTLGPGLNTGFEISVPADTSVRALKVYVGAYASRMHFEAALSDGSAPPYTDESFVNPSDGPNRVYTLTFAAGSPGQKLTVRFWLSTLVDPDWGNVTLQSAVVREAAPIVSLQMPANGSIFNPASAGLLFTASTIAPFSIAPGQVGCELNGVDVSSSLVVSGTPTARSALCTNLVPNQFYRGQIWAVDNLGHGTTNFVSFDTFSTNGAVVIEAEDYNHDSGQFIDYPAPGAYAGLTGGAEVDYHTVNTLVNDYRPADPLEIPVAAETRPYFLEAGTNNYIVMAWNVDDWQNYTRTFPNAEYHVYLRYGALVDQLVRLDLVTGDRTQPNQTVTPIGLLSVSPTANENAYAYAPLTDASSNLLAVALSGVQTLRLTGSNVVSAYEGLRADFLMLVPSMARPRLSISASPSQVTISFPTQTGSSYTVQYKNSLTDPAWESILPAVTGDGSIKSVSQPKDQRSRFYRLSGQ